MEGDEKSGVPLTCGECCEEANKCSNCGDVFDAGQKIICAQLGMDATHFCDDDCLKEYLKKDECFKMVKSDCTMDSEVLEEADG